MNRQERDQLLFRNKAVWLEHIMCKKKRNDVLCKLCVKSVQLDDTFGFRKIIQPRDGIPNTNVRTPGCMIGGHRKSLVLS
jgi:hypothetical protein